MEFLTRTRAPACCHGAAPLNDLLHRGTIGFTTRADGRPHVKPVWGLWFEGQFYFSTSPNSTTGQDPAARPSLAMHLESGDDVVILEGTVRTITDRSFLSRLDEAYYAKYSYHLVGNAAGAICVLNPEVAFAWLEKDFVGSATRYRFAH